MNEFELYKNSPNNFTIKLSKPNEALLMSLYNHIEGLSVSSDYNACSFNSMNVQTFDNFIESHKKLNGTTRMRYEFVETMVSDICRQVSYLIETYRKCFYTMQTKYIIVIDNGNKLLYVSYNDLLDIKDNSIFDNIIPTSATYAYSRIIIECAKQRGFRIDNPNNKTKNNTPYEYV